MVMIPFGHSVCVSGIDMTHCNGLPEWQSCIRDLEVFSVGADPVPQTSRLEILNQ